MVTTANGNEENRNELLQRLELMETMIAEGRQATVCNGWIFVLWGVLCLMPTVWQLLQPHSHWAGKWSWPVCMTLGYILMPLGIKLQKRRELHRSVDNRSIKAVWRVMGVAMAVYVISAIVSHFTWQVSYVAAILLLLGMAHLTSAAILRWRVQGLVGIFYWLGAISMFSDLPSHWINVIFLLEMCIGGIVFGLYAMMLERRERSYPVQHG